LISRRFRAALALILAVLLVSMQRELPVHALTHAAAAALANQPAWHVTVDERCLQCQLLAAGEHAVVADAHVCSATSAPADDTLAPPLAPALAHRSFYRSRAPPAFA